MSDTTNADSVIGWKALRKTWKTGNKMEGQIEINCEDRSWIELPHELTQLRALVSVMVDIQTVLP
jgi:hypothetical protein